MEPIIFLDIDGVLNRHVMNAADCCGIDHRCAAEFNRVLKKTGAKIVISSAWRYMLLGQNPPMRILGFELMLQTYGIRANGKIIGNTISDETCTWCGCHEKTCDANCPDCKRPSTRGNQISRWVGAHEITRYVVLDDMDLGISAAAHPFVQTNPDKGLTHGKADQAIRILTANSTLNGIAK